MSGTPPPLSPILLLLVVAIASMTTNNGFLLLPAVHANVRSSINKNEMIMPYSLGVRDSIMIAHSFHNHPAFGPAGGVHGATYTCDVEFQCRRLNPETNWVLDIGKASDVVCEVLQKYNLKNLDEVFGKDVMTTTEFMARQIHDDVQERLEQECQEFNGRVCVKLWESHKAWASFQGTGRVSYK